MTQFKDQRIHQLKVDIKSKRTEQYKDTSQKISGIMKILNLRISYEVLLCWRK